ncbi:MAG: alanine racemase [Synergistaceae bacterium]|nr:alanine racemase [Synergistaceae bacterium]
MFLNILKRRNPQFIEAAAALHRKGLIPANSYVLDLDTIDANVGVLAAEGKKLGLRVFPMTKQIGRCPAVTRILLAHGIEGCVAVDMADAKAVFNAGLGIGHLGHLVQVPGAEASAAASMKPEYWTVFSYDKAREAALANETIGRVQKLLARVYAEGDIFYSGHEGGFKATEAVEEAKNLDSLNGVRFAGITTFPALLYDEKHGGVEPTPNLKTLENVASALGNAGFEKMEINSPGTTSSVVMRILADAGTTQVEPGHGMTGTTPLHALRDLPEAPAVLYLSEVSHMYNGQAYCFGGGLYIDPVFPDYDVHALVGTDPEAVLKQEVRCFIPSPASIDYYGRLDSKDVRVATGDTVVLGFRAQAFVRRAWIVAVGGVKKGTPYVEGIYNTEGARSAWPH